MDVAWAWTWWASWTSEHSSDLWVCESLRIGVAVVSLPLLPPEPEDHIARAARGRRRRRGNAPVLRMPVTLLHPRCPDGQARALRDEGSAAIDGGGAAAAAAFERGLIRRGARGACEQCQDEESDDGVPSDGGWHRDGFLRSIVGAIVSTVEWQSYSYLF